MRVALVAEVYLPKVDGVVVRTGNLIRELTARGDDVLVACPEPAGGYGKPSAPAFDDPATDVVRCRSFPFPAYPEYRVGLPDRALVERVRAFRPDVVHYVNPFAFGFRCHDALVRGGVTAPTLFSFHTLYGEFVKRYKALGPLSNVLWGLTRAYHNLADANLTVSAATREDLAGRGFERVGLWPPAVDAATFAPERRRPELRSRWTDGRPDRPLLLTVSRLAPEKNVGLLAEVLRRLPAAGVRDAKLLIVGDGPARPALETRFAGLDTQFLGYRKGAALAEAYATADAFVYASETETMGNVVLEAQAAGTPVIAPRAGGLTSVVDDGITGLLYPPGDADAAARQVAAALTDVVLNDRLCAAGRAATAHLTWAAAAESVRADYEAVIARHDPDRLRPRGSAGARATAATLVTAFRVASAFGPRPAGRRAAAADVQPIPATAA